MGRKLMNNSHFYIGDVFHCRLMPKQHSFKYNFFWTAIGLDEMKEVFYKHPFWSLEKWNVSSFRRKDHLGDLNKPLEQCVKELIESKVGVKPTGSIQLITHMAYFGFRFNPVSFYVLRNKYKKIEFIVAEINNTPWGEQFCYVIDARHQLSDSIYSEMKKQFHISPFFSMNMEYKWKFSFTENELKIQMENWENGNKVFQVSMQAKELEINKRSMSRVLLKYPFMTAQVFWGIYWQALRLWLKKIPVYSHPKFKKGESHVS
jgi:DUF1365 family protein